MSIFGGHFSALFQCVMTVSWNQPQPGCWNYLYMQDICTFIHASIQHNISNKKFSTMFYFELKCITPCMCITPCIFQILNDYFSTFAYWCEIKGLQLVLFELCSLPCLWRLTLFSFLALAVVILESSSLHSSVISVVESECCGGKKWQW